MKILFVHQNFPAQFRHLSALMAQHKGWDVRALAMPSAPLGISGVQAIQYKVSHPASSNLHPWMRDLEAKVLRGEAAYRAAVEMRAQGYVPDVIVAHPGWGEALFLRDVWPQARLGLYCEFFYHAKGADTDFDPEFPGQADDESRLAMKNAGQLMQMDKAHAGLSPTQWQCSLYPQPFRSKISVIHEGVNTEKVVPNPQAALKMASGVTLNRSTEVITFVNRNLEPMRGFHTFMRALPLLQKARPHARVVVVGGDEVSYGSSPPKGQTWRRHYGAEVFEQVDWSRVHFVGRIPYVDFLQLLQVSTVHVYLTYPFVLSWSMLEAMSTECAIVGSDTPPVREVMRDGETGLLTSFFDPQALTDRVLELLDSPDLRARLGRNARAYVQSHYDLHRICLPAQVQWVEQLAQLPL